MNNKVRSLIKESLIATANYEVRIAESLPTPAINFSSIFENRIKGIEVGAPKKTKPQITSRRLVIAIIAAVLLLALSITACAYREQIGDLIESIFEDHNEYDKISDTVSEIDSVVAPTYIPHGYEETQFTKTTYFVDIYWKQTNQMINLYYSPINNGKINADTEGAVLEEITVDNVEIKIFTKHSSSLSIWSDGKYSYMLSCPEELGLEEIEKIIRSIEPVENAGE